MCEKRKEKMIIEIALLMINWITPEHTNFTKFAEFTLTIEDAQEYVYSISPTKRVRGWRDIEEKSYF